MSTKKVTLIDRLADNNWTPFIIALIVFLIWSGGTYLLYDHYYRERPDWAGQFGDMFGAANSLFSGLAFAGLVYTIILQRKELNLTRRELNLTRREFKQQNQTMIQQRFENTFFNMLKLHNDSTETLKIDYVLFDRRAQALGKEGFHAIYDKLRLAKG